MIEKEPLICVLEVPLRENGDYDRKNIQYSSEYDWTDNDKNKLEDLINELLNSLDKTGQENISTSVGNLIIKYEEHPKVERRKLIQGFLKLKNSSSANFSSDIYILSILKEVTPDSIKNNQEAIKYLEIIDMLVKPSNQNNHAKLHVFNSVLQILLENKDEYTEDGRAAERLSTIIANLRKLYHGQDEHHS